MSTQHKFVAVALLSLIAAIAMQTLRPEAPGDDKRIDDESQSARARSARPVGALAARPAEGTASPSASSPDDRDESEAGAGAATSYEAAPTTPESAPMPVTPERRRRFQEIVADEEMSSASGKKRVRQLISAGLSRQDAEAAVRRYYMQIGDCVLDAIEAKSSERNLRFNAVFAEIERALENPETAHHLFDLSGADEMLEYCDLVASQSAGLQ